MGDFVDKATAWDECVKARCEGYEQGWKDCREAAVTVMDAHDLEYAEVCKDAIRSLTPKDTSHD